MKYQVTTKVQGNKITVTLTEASDDAFSHVVETADGVEYREVFTNAEEAKKFYVNNK